MSYRKYDPMVMKMIIETGNRNLFPELNIPRTTINYWLKSSKTKVTSKRDIVFEKRISHPLVQVMDTHMVNLLSLQMSISTHMVVTTFLRKRQSR